MITRPRVARWLLVPGLAALLLAQVLPVYRYRAIFDNDKIEFATGFAVTLGGWISAVFAGSSSIIFEIGWSTNVWVVVALVAHLLHRRRLAIATAAIATATAVIGIAALATIETLEHILGLEAGAWIWLFSIVLLSGGVILSALTPAASSPVRRYVPQEDERDRFRSPQLGASSS